MSSEASAAQAQARVNRTAPHRLALLPKFPHTQADPTAKALVDDLAGLMSTHINTFDARGLANSAWAFGKLKYAPNQKLPALIASAAISKLDSFSAQNLSNLLWSFVYLHYRNEELLEAVSKQVCCLLCGPQHRLCHAATRLRRAPAQEPQTWSSLLCTVFAGRRSSRCCWTSEPRVLTQPCHAAYAACVQVVSKVDEFKPQELANVVWALASMEHHSPDLMEVCSRDRQPACPAPLVVCC